MLLNCKCVNCFTTAIITRSLICTLQIVFVFVCEDMVVPEFGETQQSVCEAVGWPTEADMYVSDQEALRLLLQVHYLKN